MDIYRFPQNFEDLHVCEREKIYQRQLKLMDELLCLSYDIVRDVLIRDIIRPNVRDQMIHRFLEEWYKYNEAQKENAEPFVDIRGVV